MVKQILMSPWMIGGAVTAALWLAARFTDPEKAYEIGKSRGRWISQKMRATQLGAKAWERIEDFSERLIMAYFKGFIDGLDEDDNIPEAAVEPQKPL